MNVNDYNRFGHCLGHPDPGHMCRGVNKARSVAMWEDASVVKDPPTLGTLKPKGVGMVTQIIGTSAFEQTGFPQKNTSSASSLRPTVVTQKNFQFGTARIIVIYDQCSHYCAPDSTYVTDDAIT
jgi:hypothetical protein